MASFKTEGIILKRINFGEADRILTIFSKHFGKIKVLAKGVRKLTSRKAGALELFNHSSLFLVKGRNFDIISEAEPLNLFKSWRKDLLRVGIAYYFCEVIDKLTPEGQPNKDVFELLKNSLSALGKNNLKNLVLSFQENLLETLGFGIPPGVARNTKQLHHYIESISERTITSPRIIQASFTNKS
jgi:DNA repair protein RecO (recombination protein O)